MEGWIKIHRKIMESPMYFGEKFNRIHAWIDLLMLANYEDSLVYIRGQKVAVKRGQVSKSKEFLAKRWGWSKHTVLKFLIELQEENMIELQNSKLIGLISIVNYERYQECAPQTAPQNQSFCAPQNAPQTAPQKNSISVSVSNGYESIVSDSAPQNAPQTAPQNAPQTAPPNKNIKNIYIDNSIIPFSHNASSSDNDSAVDYSKFLLFFNSELDKNNSIIPKIHSIANRRKTALAARCREFGKEALAEAVRKAAASDFLNGRNDRAWHADFDWIFRPNNFPKILEGNYDNGTNQNISSVPDTVQQRQQQAADIIMQFKQKQREQSGIG